MAPSKSPRRLVVTALTLTAIAISALALSGCGGGNVTETTAPAASETVKTEVTSSTEGVSYAEEGDLLLAMGQFEGRSSHVTTGRITIVKRADGTYVELGKGFSLDGAPDPVLGFGMNGEYIAATKFSALNELNGAQTYKLDAGFDLEQYDSIFVWCEQFSVPLGVAALAN